MPGILPMKVIKVGSSSQSRIAQACDRCRSKKIRCDGVTPCCSQCANVGFECKTSDKLSRRAFPRGYTESLEERVRALESEIRELKVLVDEKEEKIDLLSKIHAFSPDQKLSTASASPGTQSANPSAVTVSKDVIFEVHQAPYLQDGDQKSDSYFLGPSSGRSFIDAVKSKIQESGKSVCNLNAKALFTKSTMSKPTETHDVTKSPPRLVSDQFINVFFQEWAPLFPILHRPTFLKLYSEYVANPEGVKNSHSIAQLNLVFGIAALANESNDKWLQNLEAQWQGALNSVTCENTLPTLQCLVLAQIYCMAKGDSDRLLHYTGIAVNLSNRLGLHQSQKRFSLGALTRETRKKVFWSLYTLDCFTAATLGMPKLMKDEDIETEEPSDVDDENVTERGYQTALPGVYTKLSSALALFRAARIMSKVLKELYPANSTYELSLQKVGALSEELDVWWHNLAAHLRLEFAQDKPSTNIISSRSPLLALTYYYIRTLIHRPVSTSGLGARAQSSIVALADSSKRIIQVLQLLKERHMSFTICLNKGELLVLSGFGLLFQGLGLKAEGKLIQDTQRYIHSTIELLNQIGSPSLDAFKNVVRSLIPEDAAKSPEAQERSSKNSMSPPRDQNQNIKGQLQALASRFSFSATRGMKQEQCGLRRAAAPNTVVSGNLALYSRTRGSQISLGSTSSEPSLGTRRSLPTISSNLPQYNGMTNLDYFPLGSHTSNTDNIAQKSTSTQNPTDLDSLLGYISTYETSPPPPNGAPCYISPESLTYPTPSLPSDWNPDVWSSIDVRSQQPTSARSVLSFSDESLTSGEDLSSCDFGSDYRSYAIPTGEYKQDDFDLSNFGL